MICNKCGTDVPSYSKFCIRCGNRLAPADAAQPSQPSSQPSQTPPPSAPKPASSGSPFGGKQISDRHYSLEEIARQQEESSNSIGLPPAPSEKKRKKKRSQPETELPPVGTSDSMELNMGSSNGTPQVQQSQPSQPSTHSPTEQPMMNPLLQPLSELTKAPPQKGKPVKHEAAMPQPSGSANPLLPSLSELTQEPSETQKPAVSSAEAAARMAEKQAAPSVPSAAPQNVPSAEPSVPAYTGEVYRYSITTPPVPSGLQQQSNIPLFGGDIRLQADELRRNYFARKNGTAAQQ